MTYRHGLTLALALGTALPVLAQSPEAPPTLRHQVGLGISPFFMRFLEASGSFPPSVWATVPAGARQENEGVAGTGVLSGR